MLLLRLRTDMVQILTADLFGLGLFGVLKIGGCPSF